MSKFKVGDRVRVVSVNRSPFRGEWMIGATGVITEYIGVEHAMLKLDRPTESGGLYAPEWERLGVKIESYKSKWFTFSDTDLAPISKKKKNTGNEDDTN